MKIFSLIYNELVKQFKKTSIKVIVALILLSAIAIPIVLNKIKLSTNYYFNKESLEYNINQTQSSIDALKNKTGQDIVMMVKYLEIDNEHSKILLDNTIGYNEWRSKEADEYKTYSYMLANIEFVLEGFSRDIVIQNLRSDEAKKVEEYYNLTLAKKKEIEAEYTAKKDEILNVINTNDFMKHTELEMGRINDRIAINNDVINEYEKLKAKNPTAKEEMEKLNQLEKDKDIALRTIEQLKQDLEILQFRYDNGIDYNEDNWKHNAIVEIEKTLRDYRIDMMDEASYNLDYNQSLATSYEEYKVGFEKARKGREERIKELWYSLEKNIPDLGAVKDARSIIDSTYEVYVIFAVIMSIILGGGIVAGEFSTGTIRLLLIRPVSRWKILLAKLIAVLLVGYGILVLGTTILVVTSGSVFGFDTLQIPVLQTLNGNITETSYLSYMIPKLAISSASLIFVSSIVFMISTLAKNTALAVAGGMLLYIGAAPLSELLINFKQLWLIDTFVPYINSSYLKLLPALSNRLAETGLSLKYTSGAVQLLIISLVVLVITFVAFVKRDVKNN